MLLRSWHAEAPPCYIAARQQQGRTTNIVDLIDACIALFDKPTSRFLLAFVCCDEEGRCSILAGLVYARLALSDEQDNNLDVVLLCSYAYVGLVGLVDARIANFD
jgi:hypothetical protein